MATKTAIICDVCGREKKDVNHWFLVETSEGFHIDKAESIEREKLNLEITKDVCGQNCATKLFSEWMTDANTTAKAPDTLDDNSVQEMQKSIPIKE